MTKLIYGWLPSLTSRVADTAARRARDICVTLMLVGGFAMTMQANAQDPLAVPGAGRTVLEGDEVTLDGSASVGLAFEWTQRSGPGVSLRAEPNPARFGDIRIFTAPTQLNENVELVFQLSALVSLRRNEAQVAVVILAGANDPPIARITAPNSVVEGGTATLDGSASSDPEGQLLTYAWVQTAPINGAGSGLNLIDANTATPHFASPTRQAVTDVAVTFSLTVTDPGRPPDAGLSHQTTVEVMINPTSSSAIAVANAGTSVAVPENRLVALNGALSTGDTIAWAQISGPPVVLRHTSADGRMAEFNAPDQLHQDIELVFELTASSGTMTDSARVTITVTAGVNDPPVASTTGPRSVVAGATVTLDASGSSDPEGQSLTYSWTQVLPPTGPGMGLALIDADTAALKFVVPSSALVSDVNVGFRVSVTDSGRPGQNGKISRATAQTTINAPTPPVASSRGGGTRPEGNVGGTGRLHGSFSVGAYVTWEQISGPPLPNQRFTKLRSEVEYDDPLQLNQDSVSVFELTAWSGSMSDTELVTLTFTAGPNDAPTARVLAPARAEGGETVTLNGRTSHDPERQPLTYTWAQTAPTSGAGSGIDLIADGTATPMFVVPDLSADVAVTFRLTVTDPGRPGAAGLSHQATAQITLNTAPTNPSAVPTVETESTDALKVGDTVVLTGIGSTDDTTDYLDLIYTWRQISGATVTLTPTPATVGRPIEQSFVVPNDARDGVLVFGLIVEDEDGLESLEASVTVTVRRPFANAGPNQDNVDWGESVTLDGSGSFDPNGINANLVYVWRQVMPLSGPGSSLTIDNSGAATPTFVSPNANVRLAFVLQVTDAESPPLSSTQPESQRRVEINVVAATIPVTRITGGDADQNEGATVTLDGSTSTDPNGDDAALTYVWSVAAAVPPAGAPAIDLSSVDTSQSSLTVTMPTNLLNDADYAFTLTVTDPETLSSSVTVVVSVDAINDAPTADPGSGRLLRQGTTVTLDGSGSRDAETASADLIYEWTYVSITGEDVPLVGADTATPTFVVPEDGVTSPRDSIISFRLMVTDTSTDSKSATDTVAYMVNTNQMPVTTGIAVNGINYSGIEPRVDVSDGTTVTLNANQSEDPDGDIVIFEWTLLSPAQVPGEDPFVFLNNPGRRMTTFNVPQLKTDMQLIFQVEVGDIRPPNIPVADEIGVPLQPRVIITVRADNDPPTAEAGEAQMVEEGVPVTLSGTFTDPDLDLAPDPDPGDTHTCVWTNTVPGNVVVTNGEINGSMCPATFTSPDTLLVDTDFTFQLTVTDAGGLSASDTVIITVDGMNAAPIANAGPDQNNVAEGVRVTLNGLGSNDSEDDGSGLDYTWTQISPSAGPGAGVTLDSSTDGAPEFTATTLDQGTMAVLTFSLTVTDSEGLASVTADTVMITVVAANDAPMADAGDDQSAQAGEIVTLDGSGSSDPGDTGPLTYAWDWTQTGGSTSTSARTSDVIDFVADAQGGATFTTPSGLASEAILTFTLTVTDTGGLFDTNPRSDTDTVTITVAANTNSDAINQILLPEMARAMTDSSITTIARRLENARQRSDSGSFAIGGHSNLASALNAERETRDFTQLLADSEFVLPLAANNRGAAKAEFWARGDRRELKTPSGTELNWQGDLSSVHVGVDSRLRDDLLVGFAVSRMQGELTYQDSNSDTPNLRQGEYQVDMNSVHPYVGWRAGGLDLWATAGYGGGDVAVHTPTETNSSQVNLLSVGIGGNGRLLQRGVSDLRLKGEAMHGDMKVVGDDDLAALTANISRLRMTLEGTQTRRMADGSVFAPSVEVGVRHDDGDGDTGSGGEIGGGLDYRNPSTRTSIGGRVRALLGHSGDYEEWGIQANWRRLPGTDGQGLSFDLSPGYGDSSSRVQQLWQHAVPLADNTATDNYHARLDARLAWGLPMQHILPQQQGMLTPYSSMTLSQTDSLRVGINWATDTRFDLNLQSERTSTEHIVLLKGTVRF